MTRGTGNGGSGGSSRGEAESVTSILKPGKETNGGGKMKRVRIRTQVEPITTIFPNLESSTKELPSSNQETYITPVVQVSPSTTSCPPVDKLILEICSYCEIYFDNIEELNDHKISTHYGTKVNGVFTCSSCETVHLDYGDYMNHCLNIHTIYPIGITSEDQLQMSSSSMYKLPRQCNICNIIFSNTIEMKDHFTTHHGSSIAYKCRLCRKYISDILLLKKHLQLTHFVQFQCPSPLAPPSISQ